MVAERTTAELGCQLKEANKIIAEMNANKDSQIKLFEDLRTRELIPKPGKYHAMSQSHPIPSHPIPSHPIPSHPIPSHPIPCTLHIPSHSVLFLLLR
jgi:hypothetical protein